MTACLLVLAHIPEGQQNCIDEYEQYKTASHLRLYVLVKCVKFIWVFYYLTTMNDTFKNVTSPYYENGKTAFILSVLSIHVSAGDVVPSIT